WNAWRMYARNWLGLAAWGVAGSSGATRRRGDPGGPSSRRTQRGVLAPVVSQTSSPLSYDAIRVSSQSVGPARSGEGGLVEPRRCSPRHQFIDTSAEASR